MANDQKHVCKLVVSWMCEYCPTVIKCQSKLHKGEMNYKQMCICIDNMVMFNTGHFPNENEINERSDKNVQKENT